MCLLDAWKWAEVWVTLDKRRDVLSFDPHFVGTSRVRVRLDSIYDIPEELSGGLKVWIQSPEALQAERSYPFTLSVPDWDATHGVLQQQMSQAKGPLTFDLQLTAFAEEINCYDTEDDYYKAQTAEHPFAAEHFVPTGLFVAEDEFPSPVASFAGTVIGGRALVNPVTQLQTVYLSVQTLSMVIDVVADPVLFKKRPKMGGIVHGSFFLSGRTYVTMDHMKQWQAQHRR